MSAKIYCIGIAVCISLAAQAQRKNSDQHSFQFSIVPGLGTNGLHPGGFRNVVSVNLTSGYSKATLLFELAGISNLNTDETRGLQIAGLANLTGANAFFGLTEKEADKKVKTGFEANLTGMQISGLTNIVLTNVFGGQLTGGVNISKGALMGTQLAGISNIVNKYSFGLQLAGLWNSSVQSMDGTQIAGLMNYTSGDLHGVQISAFNMAGYIEGRNSSGESKETALQLGIINSAKRMNGFQVGLINYAKRSQGVQIGLINIYRGGKDVGSKDGTAIGLINAGDVGHVAFYADELFFTNYEITTGNAKNRRIQNASFTRYNLNSLIFSNSSTGFIPQQKSWALGYALKHYVYNRSAFPGMGEFRFFAYGIEILHINHEAKSITRELSLLMRPKVQFGTRLHPKLQMIYVFAAVTYNFYVSKSEEGISPSFQESHSTVNGKLLEMWPGFSAGIHLHD
uniref:Uncharacterized protein n=1 Tax=uncultured organism TaxID=155900 RepID=A0A8A1V4G3_9ZZZZ|nr:hypothetical protein [uncultured organism]